MTADLAAYVSLTFLLVVTPGATTAVVVRNAIAGGLAGGIRTALGAAAANATQASAAGLGLSVLVRRSPMLEDGIRFAGAAYLAWLAVVSLAAVVRRPAPAHGVPETAEPSARTSFREGLVVNLLNPPIATFYLAVVPTFTQDGAPLSFALLAAIHIVMAFACHVTWAAGLDRLRGWRHDPRVPRVLAAVTGACLLFLAWRVLRG